MSNRAIGENWSGVRSKVFTQEEIAESDLRVSLICELIDARKERGITQKELEEMTGIKQPAIARIEKGGSTPNIETMLKLLIPLGKTLKIVPLDESYASVAK